MSSFLLTSLFQRDLLRGKICHIKKKKKALTELRIQRCVTEKFQGSKLFLKSRRGIKQKKGGGGGGIAQPSLFTFFFSFSCLYVECVLNSVIPYLLWSSPKQTWRGWSPHGPERVRLWGSPAARVGRAPGDFWVWMAAVLSDLSDYPSGQLDWKKNMRYKSHDMRSCPLCVKYWLHTHFTHSVKVWKCKPLVWKNCLKNCKKNKQKQTKHGLDIPSLTIPTTRHFWKRQNWQRFLRRLSTGQFLFAKHTYFAFFWTVRCKEKKTTLSLCRPVYNSTHRTRTVDREVTPQ